MGKIVLVTGGTRSGKSAFAEQHLWHEQRVCYIATGVMTQPDIDFQERVRQHQQRRPQTWVTLEQFDHLDQHFTPPQYAIYLLDCATLLTSNLLFQYVSQHFPDKLELTDSHFLTKTQQIEVMAYLQQEWCKLLQAIQNTDATVWIVTNEVGMGIVPETRLGRFYRDVQGKINQLIAKEADEVHLVICGLSQRLK